MKGFRVKNKLTHKLLGAISISLVGTFLILMIFLRIVGNIIDRSNIDVSKINPIYVYSLFFIIFAMVIVSFIAIFLLLIQRKLSYLKHITESINDIAKGELNLKIDIKEG